MITNSIVKLIDEAVLPAVALIVAKILGLLATSIILNLSFTIQFTGPFNLLPTMQFENLAGYITAENFSNLAMFIVAAIGASFVLIRAHYFHQSHIHPNLHAKLVSLKLENLVAPSYHLYHQTAIWLLFLWLTSAFLLISTIFLKITYPLISATAFIICVNFTWILASDIQKEIEISQQL